LPTQASRAFCTCSAGILPGSLRNRVSVSRSAPLQNVSVTKNGTEDELRKIDRIRSYFCEVKNARGKYAQVQCSNDRDGESERECGSHL
jgi:hypothetical protein